MTHMKKQKNVFKKDKIVPKTVTLKTIGKKISKNVNQVFISIIRLRHATLLKKKLHHNCFAVNFAKLLRTNFFYRTPPGDCF